MGGLKYVANATYNFDANNKGQIYKITKVLLYIKKGKLDTKVTLTQSLQPGVLRTRI